MFFVLITSKSYYIAEKEFLFFRLDPNNFCEKPQTVILFHFNFKKKHLIKCC